MQLVDPSQHVPHLIAGGVRTVTVVTAIHAMVSVEPSSQLFDAHLGRFAKPQLRCSFVCCGVIVARVASPSLPDAITMAGVLSLAAHLCRCVVGDIEPRHCNPLGC